MPPSGYSGAQVVSIADFLSSCARALKAEAAERSEPLPDALRREVRDIAGFKPKPNVSEVQAAVLSLTEEFYVRLERRAVTDDNYSREVESVLSEMGTEILAIKI